MNTSKLLAYSRYSTRSTATVGYVLTWHRGEEDLDQVSHNDQVQKVQLCSICAQP